MQLSRHPVWRMARKGDSFRRLRYDDIARWQCFVTFRLDNASRMSERFIRCTGSVTHVPRTYDVSDNIDGLKRPVEYKFLFTKKFFARA